MSYAELQLVSARRTWPAASNVRPSRAILQRARRGASLAGFHAARALWALALITRQASMP